MTSAVVDEGTVVFIIDFVFPSVTALEPEAEMFSVGCCLFDSFLSTIAVVFCVCAVLFFVCDVLIGFLGLLVLVSEEAVLFAAVFRCEAAFIFLFSAFLFL